MDPQKKLLARKLFRLRVYESTGQAFQQLFEQVMSYGEPNFVPIRPYGNVGDRKNDGYIPPSGTYFQVFAPEDPSQPRAVLRAAAKAADDFHGLIENWDHLVPLRTYHFVFNDSYRGSPPQVEEALARIRKKAKVSASVFLAKDLEARALRLPEDQLSDVLNFMIPEPRLLPSVDFRVLRDIINHVQQNRRPFTEASLTAPDFQQKIAFNGLTSPVANLLTIGSYQTDAVSDYFSRNSNFARQQLRDELASMYAASRERFHPQIEEKKHLGDTIFFDLLEGITPPSNSLSESERLAQQDAALVVMAFYFEACDIFEDPDATS